MIAWMRGVGVLLWKAARESRTPVAWICLAMGIAVFVGTRALPPLQDAVRHLAEHIPFVNAIVAASLGGQTVGSLSMRLLIGLLWAHPFVLALAWTPALVLCTRYPAGEIEQGTIDVTLGWPVSRLQIAAAEATLWMGAGILVHLTAWGAWCLAAEHGRYPDLPDGPTTRQVLLNLYAAFLAAGGFASLVSAWSSGRGRAQGIVFGVGFTSYLIGVLSPFWPPVAALRALGIGAYYEPGRILMSGRADPSHLATLLAVFVICEGLALWRIRTRPMVTT